MNSGHINNLDELLNSDDVNGGIIDIDNFIGDLCSHGTEMEKLSAAQRVFYLNQNLEREVNNGGFEQYFINSSGDYAYETLDSLNEIGAHRTAEILQRALDIFPDSNAQKHREERIKVITQLLSGSAVWDKLDDEFLRYEDNLNELNIEFIRKHHDQFKV